MKHAISLLVLSASLSACVGEIGTGALSSGAGGNTTPIEVPETGGTTGFGGVSGVGGSEVPSPTAGSFGNSGGGVSGAGTSGSGGSAGLGTGGVTGTAGSSGIVTPACGVGAIPADVAAVLTTRCVACHGNPPLVGVPTSLTTYAQLTAHATSDPTKSVVVLALARMQDGAKPMPPAPLSRATVSEIAAFQAWVTAGTSAPPCADGGAPADAGTGGDAGPIIDPYNTPAVCTSKTTWTRGNSGSASMNPGLACINCHTSMKKGPALDIAGTIFPTAHEPDLCNGGSLTTSAKVIITGANGQSVTLVPNTAGNFRYTGTIAKPYTAKVSYMGRERTMLEGQTSGDCNSCHTQAGLMKAPGRIMLP